MKTPIDISQFDGCTPGPWITWQPDGIESISIGQSKQIPIAKVFTGPRRIANATLIASGPALVAEVKALREENNKLRDALIKISRTDEVDGKLNTVQQRMGDIARNAIA